MKPEKKSNNGKTETKKILKKKKNSGNTRLILGLAGIILLAGIAYGLFNNDPAEDKPVKSEIKLPSYAYTNPLTLKAYRYATEHPDMLEQIPCYCGCGGMDHRFLRDCFINDDRTYEEHASFCDICVGEALKVQEYLGKGMSLKEVRANIDTEYSKYIDGKTSTPPVSDNYIPILTAQAAELSSQGAMPSKSLSPVDLSKYSLSENFNSLADGLKLTPPVVNRAYFANNKLLINTELETPYVISMSRDYSFYNRMVIGMFSADYRSDSWIEMHDLGYDNTNDATLRGVIEQGMKNIVYTRPLIYGHMQNVDNVMRLMKDPDSMATSYDTYEQLLDVVDYQNAGIAMVIKEQTSFSDMNYWSLTPVNGKIELVKAYSITDTDSIPAAFDSYAPQMNGNVLIIKVTGDLTTVRTEKDNIDAVARA